MGLLLAAKSSTKLLAPTDPILGPENLLKTGFAQKGLPSCLSSRHKPQSFIETKTLRFCNPDTKNFKKWTWTRSQKWDRLAVPFLGPHAQLSKRTKEKYFHGMSNKVPSSEVTKWILRSSHDSFLHFCDDSAGKTKAKHMENGFDFPCYYTNSNPHDVLSVQSKYSKKTKSISLLGFVISNKTCKIWNVQIQCQPSRLSSPSRWKPNSFLPMQKRPMDSSHHRCQIFTLNFSDQCQTKYDLLTIPSCTSAMILPAKLKRNIWKMVWFSMLLYKFKSSRCSPCNQSTQRRRKVYRCPIFGTVWRYQKWDRKIAKSTAKADQCKKKN